jgi:signal peptidase II
VLLPTIPAVLAMDQLSKHLIRINLTPGQSWPTDGLLRLTHATNSGSAFGLFTGQTPILIVASLVAIAFLVYFYRTRALPSLWLRFAIGLHLGGAFGNLIDRLRAGEVVDFIDLGWWPIFNLADSSIVVGMILLIGVLVLGDDRREPPGQTESRDLSDAGSLNR